MSPILDEPPVDPIRSYFSQQCVMLTGIASGVVEAPAGDALHSPTYHMGRRDGLHVVVAHLASSRTLKEAADKCVAFGRGVEERADTHPYGPDWSQGFAQATMEAACRHRHVRSNIVRPAGRQGALARCQDGGAAPVAAPWALVAQGTRHRTAALPPRVVSGRSRTP
ncbi:hypothetical protein [Gemmatimonas sp.]|uniref:hypothetical protein n=1 Tax=Gemmatimonas sp. TaxID=1962908 RepID=UPI003DA6AC45